MLLLICLAAAAITGGSAYALASLEPKSNFWFHVTGFSGWLLYLVTCVILLNIAFRILIGIIIYVDYFFFVY